MAFYVVVILILCCKIKWSPALTILKALKKYQSNLSQKEINKLNICPNSPERLMLYNNNRKAFWKIAQ